MKSRLPTLSTKMSFTKSFKGTALLNKQCPAKCLRYTCSIDGVIHLFPNVEKEKFNLPSLAPHHLMDKPKFLRMASKALLMIWPFPKFPASFSATNHLVLNALKTAFTSSKLYYFFASMFLFVPLPPIQLENSYSSFKNSSSEISGKSFLILLVIKTLSSLLNNSYNLYMLPLLYLSH